MRSCRLNVTISLLLLLLKGASPFRLSFLPVQRTKTRRPGRKRAVPYLAPPKGPSASSSRQAASNSDNGSDNENDDRQAEKFPAVGSSNTFWNRVRALPVRWRHGHQTKEKGQQQRRQPKRKRCRRRRRSLMIGMSLQESIVALALYLAFGLVAFHFVLEKSWSVLDALYFSCSCLTTVGYGDLCPSTPASKLFTTVFGLGGIAFLGSAVAAVGHQVLELERHAMDKAQHLSRQSTVAVFDDMHKLLKHHHQHQQHHHGYNATHFGEKNKTDESSEESTTTTTLSLMIWSRLGKVGKAIQHQLPFLQRVFRQCLPSLLLIILGSAVLQRLNGTTGTGGGGAASSSWTPLESLYFAFITASTIGFGDFVPQTRAARAFAVLYLPMAVACAGEVFSNIALACADRRQQHVFERELLMGRGLSMNHLRSMDADHSGRVSREEYVTFMLVEMGRVETHELDQLRKQFERLDVTQNGYLDRDDLRLMAKLKRQKHEQEAQEGQHRKRWRMLDME